MMDGKDDVWDKIILLIYRLILTYYNNHCQILFISK